MGKDKSEPTQAQVLEVMLHTLSLQTDVLLTILQKVDRVEEGLDKQARTAAHLIATNKARLRMLKGQLEEVKEG